MGSPKKQPWHWPHVLYEAISITFLPPNGTRTVVGFANIYGLALYVDLLSYPACNGVGQ